MNTKNNIEKIIDDLKREKSVDDFIDNYFKKLKERNDFFETYEFNKLINIIEKYEEINQDSLLYKNTTIDGLTAKDFERVFDTIYSKLESEIKIENLYPFEKYHIDYKNIRFHLMIGQGSTYWTTKNN